MRNSPARCSIDRARPIRRVNILRDVRRTVQRAELQPIVVRVRSARCTLGVVEIGWQRFACSLGKGGVRSRKREGDGASPRGTWRTVRALYRADRSSRPRSGLDMRAIKPADGWCDAVRDRNYNRPVQHPYPASAERLWREDRLYDVVVVLDHNQQPRIRGHGSAIFLHVRRPGSAPTEGCVALEPNDLRRLLRVLVPGRRLIIMP